MVFCRRYSVGNTARLIERHKATVLYAVPSYVGTLMRRKNGTYPRLRRVFSSGAKWPRNWHQTFNTHFPNAELCEFYGASETSFISIAKSTEPVPEGSSGARICGRDAVDTRPGWLQATSRPNGTSLHRQRYVIFGLHR